MPSFAVIQGAKEALDLGITGPEGIEISRPEEVRKAPVCPLSALSGDSRDLQGGRDADKRRRLCRITFSVGEGPAGKLLGEQLPPG